MAIEDQAVRQAVETVRNRVDALGVAEPFIGRQGTDRILIQLPGVDDPGRVKEIIGTTGLLELKLVDDKGGPYAKAEDATASYGGAIPSELVVVEGFSEDTEARTRTPVYYVLKRASVVTGRDLKNARVSRDKFNQPAVEFFLNAAGAVKFGDATGRNVGKHLAIVLDNRVQSAPVINSRIDSNGIIEGNFTQEKADALTLVLKSGALPAEMIILEERTVGPSLGLDSIRKGVLASIVGMFLVFVATIFYYHLAGVNAVVALILNAIILLGAMAWLNATLTLPGIAGFILTIGMAVDSNVLIFERIREEMDNGKAPRAAIDLGFKRAFGTIIDTHVTTISAAAFLFQFGTGPVRGFAVTLVIGLAASMFTAVFVSHLLFDLDLRVEAEGRDDLHLTGRTRTRASLQEHPHRLPRRQVDLHRGLDRPFAHRPRLAPPQGGTAARHRLHGRRADRLRVQPEARREPDPVDRRVGGRQDRLRPALRQGREERGAPPDPDGEEGRARRFPRGDGCPPEGPLPEGDGTRRLRPEPERAGRPPRQAPRGRPGEVRRTPVRRPEDGVHADRAGDHREAVGGDPLPDDRRGGLARRASRPRPPPG